MLSAENLSSMLSIKQKQKFLSVFDCIDWFDVAVFICSEDPFSDGIDKGTEYTWRIFCICLDKSGYQVSIFLFCPRKHMLWVLIRSASVINHNIYFCGQIRKISILLDWKKRLRLVLSTFTRETTVETSCLLSCAPNRIVKDPGPDLKRGLTFFLACLYKRRNRAIAVTTLCHQRHW